jgi:uncharacterized protein with PIN domain
MHPTRVRKLLYRKEVNMKKLISLADYDDMVIDAYHVMMNKRVESRLNGIACPECGKELYDTTPHNIILDGHPNTNVNCSSCEYLGYRYVFCIPTPTHWK